LNIDDVKNLKREGAPGADDQLFQDDSWSCTWCI